ncbi:MAG: HEAT repeat domain-containing protein [Candidatus Micrarchaeota archaeon]
MDNVERLIAQLKSQDAAERRDAARRLAGMEGARVVPALIETLRDNDEGVAVTAAWLLIRLAESSDIDLPRIAETLRGYCSEVKGSGTGNEVQDAIGWATLTYMKIAKVFSGSKRPLMPVDGMLAEGTVKAPRKTGKNWPDIYRKVVR